MKKSTMVQDNAFRYVVSVGALLMIGITFAIGAFLLWRGSATFTQYGHSVMEFLFSTAWAPADDTVGGGKVGAGIFIIGSLISCGLALLISLRHSALGRHCS